MDVSQTIPNAEKRKKTPIISVAIISHRHKLIFYKHSHWIDCHYFRGAKTPRPKCQTKVFLHQCRSLASIPSPLRLITEQNAKTNTARVVSLIMLHTPRTNARHPYSWRLVLTKKSNRQIQQVSGHPTIAGPLFTAINIRERFDALVRGSMPLDLPTRRYRRLPEQWIAKNAIAKPATKVATEVPARISSTPPRRKTVAAAATVATTATRTTTSGPRYSQFWQHAHTAKNIVHYWNRSILLVHNVSSSLSTTRRISFRSSTHIHHKSIV